ncbi:MAG: epimerase [SAR202 cluster bacterium Io17-Chloro-G7]|nr:MAG: epimerase [SAR202 cluster bacterium Io17-Chloro-G7]
MSAEKPEQNVVTGAFGYTGKYIAAQLLSKGIEVRTLTNHPQTQGSLAEQISADPLDFENPGRLTEALRGATTLYNTYWVRFNHRDVTFQKAVANTNTLIAAAKEAGVRKIAHISITNASLESELPYFKGKGVVEQSVIESGVPYAIIRPALIFGTEDILINNIAWLLRRFPFFIIPGKGDCLVQPVYVDDLAALALDAANSDGNLVLDAVGPEIYTLEELVRLIAQVVESQPKLVRLPPWVALLGSKLLGLLVRDVLLTKDEVDGLLSNLLVTAGPATAAKKLSDWLGQNASQVGSRYASELSRHY